MSFLIKDHIHFSRSLVLAGLGSARDYAGESAEVGVSGANFFFLYLGQQRCNVNNKC